MRIAIGCDEAAFELKEIVRNFVQEQSAVPVDVTDFGVHSTEPVDYPDMAQKVAESVARGEADRGILLCGTGLGMAIAANKVPGIRAATCHDVFSAERAQKSNNAQIVALGARVIGPELAKKVVFAWLESSFSGGGSARKVEKIMRIEQKYQDGSTPLSKP
jgi:ribose 5-phosphate isomerase B